jgi:hypothetical protein
MSYRGDYIKIPKPVLKHAVHFLKSLKNEPGFLSKGRRFFDRYGDTYTYLVWKNALSDLEDKYEVRNCKNNGKTEQ